MHKFAALLLLLATAAALTLEVNNIHYGYRNVYHAQEIAVEGSKLILKDYVG
jgi:hypothetical protein